jgi:hypothetical protein
LNRTPEQIREMFGYALARSGRRQLSVLRLIGEDRLSATARDRLRCLTRKGLEPEEPDGVRGGTVQSPIAPDSAAHLSDEAWLTAFEKLHRDDYPHWTIQGFRGGANELAHILQKRVKEEPDRFLDLLQRVPLDAPRVFANAIAMGLSEVEATPERTERLFQILSDGAAGRPEDRSLIWLVRATKGDKGPLTLAFMLEAATAGDEESGVGEQVPGKADKPEPDYKRALNAGNFLDGRAMNSVRGAALLEIGAQSWANIELFKTYRDVVEPFVGSKMPDYLHASLGPMLIAALKHDLDVASDWIARTAQVCLTAFFTRNGRHILLWLDARRPEVAAPILEALAGSDDPRAQAIGCMLIAQRSLEDGRWTARIDALIEAGPTQRAAIAEIASAYVPHAAHVGRTTSWLIRLFNDDDEGVRSAAVDCFRRIDASSMATYTALYEAYVASKFFNAERTYFLHRLEKAPAAMDDVVLGLIETTVVIAKAGAAGHSHSLYQIWDPLLRIYASCGDDAKRLGRCLDVIDQLVGLDAVGSSKLNALA